MGVVVIHTSLEGEEATGRIISARNATGDEGCQTRINRALREYVRRRA